MNCFFTMFEFADMFCFVFIAGGLLKFFCILNFCQIIHWIVGWQWWLCLIKFLFSDNFGFFLFNFDYVYSSVSLPVGSFLFFFFDFLFIFC